MYQVSQTLRNAIDNGTPQRVLLEFQDAVFSNEDIVVSTGIELNEIFISDTDLTLGKCPSAEITFDLINEDYRFENFGFGKFKAWLGARIDSGTPPSGAKTKTFSGTEYDGLFEFSPLGTFIADKPDVVRKKILSITANDQMTLFDVNMPSASALGVNYASLTIGGLASAMCAYLNVPLKSSTFLNSTLTIGAEPEVFADSTMRQVLGWIAEAACCVARFNRDGQLEFAWFKTVNKTFDEHDYSDFTPSWYEVPVVDSLTVRNRDSEAESKRGTGNNAYLIQDNPFLRTADSWDAQP